MKKQKFGPGGNVMLFKYSSTQKATIMTMVDIIIHWYFIFSPATRTLMLAVCSRTEHVMNYKQIW